jgi:hypothetical protein
MSTALSQNFSASGSNRALSLTRELDKNVNVIVTV